MAFVNQRQGSRQAVSIAAVALAHVVIGYAFIAGLSGKFIKTPEFIPQIYNVPDDPPPPPPAPITKKPTQKVDIVDPIVKDPGTNTRTTDFPPSNTPIDADPK